MRARLEERYGKARPLWGSAYAASNVREFFAELTMWYVGSRGDFTSLPSPEPGPDWLACHDPDSFALLDGIYSGRLAPEPILWDELGPSLARASGPARTRASILFVNETELELERLWLDSDGNARSYGPVAPGAAVGQSTFAGHAWKLIDGEGREIGVFAASYEPHALVRITPELVESSS